MIPLARPRLGEEEAAAVAEVLGSGMLVQGERVARFERRLAQLTGRAAAVAVTNGTAALELALTVLDIGPGDEVLVPDLTWPSPAHAVRRLGAVPVLVDVDRDEWNGTAATFAAARSERTRAAIVIDQFGVPARHDEIAQALPGLPIVEDAACAIGAHAGGRPAGSFGRIACLSFHPRKVVTTGEGGAVLTDDPTLEARLRTLRNHGQHEPGRFTEAAGNHRLTDLAAAIGLVQLDRLDGFLVRRRAIAERYRAALTDLPVRAQGAPPSAQGNGQTFGLVLDESVSLSRDDVVSQLRAAGVGAGILSYALHRLPQVCPTNPGDARFAMASNIVDRGFAIPLHDTLSDDDVELVLRTLHAIVGH